MKPWCSYLYSYNTKNIDFKKHCISRTTSSSSLNPIIPNQLKRDSTHAAAQ